MFVLLPDEVNEVPDNRRLKPWAPSLWVMFAEGRIMCLVLSLVLYVVSELKFSYLTNANPTDIQIWAEDLVYPHHISRQSILAVTWNLGLCMILILYHLHFPKQSQTENFNVLYVNVLTLSSAFSYLKFKEKVSLIYKEKWQIYILRILLLNSK